MYSKKTSYEFLYIFRDVMRYGSFQRAAKEAGCTAASIGKKMAQMEAELDTVLFNPGTGGMVPTAAGLYLYDKLDTVLWNLDAMLQQTKNISSESTMELSLGISDLISGNSYRQLVQKFVESYPDIKLTLSSPPTSDLRRKLIDGRMDVAITYSVGYADEPRLVRKPLFRANPCIYYNVRMPVDASKPLGIESFRDCPFVCLDTDVAAVNMLRDLPFEPRRVIFAENLKALFLYVNAGLACTILGPAQQFNEIVDMRYFVLSDAGYDMGIDLVWEKSNTNPAIRLLVDCAEKIFR